MLTYTLRRLLGLVAVLFGVSLAVFLIMHLRPGDPALIMLGPHATDESLTRLRHEMGLDLPLYVQYGRWLGNLLHGDWGRSIQLKREVLPLLVLRFQATAWLTLVGALLAVVLGVSAGILSATRQYSWLDRTSMVGMLMAFSVPVFWLGLLLQLFLGQRLGWFPISGMQSPGDASWGDFFRHAVMPALAVATGPGAVIARMTRSSMLEVVRQDYIRTAKAKGLGQGGILFIHALKNAAVPIVTVIGIGIALLIGGAVVTESVFAIPGLGRLTIDAILRRDYPVIQGIVLLFSFVYVLVNLMIDVVYTLVDPRIRY